MSVHLRKEKEINTMFFFSRYGIILETKLAYVSILETMKNKAGYTTENTAYIKVDNPQIQVNLAILANKEVDQEKVNKYLKELEEVELIKVDKQNIFVYDVLS